jgi:UDP-N-acetylmuramoyl-tripeptide--D-alanyl-D-alanine ligase
MEFNKLVMITDGIILNYTNETCNNIVTDTREICSNDAFIPLIGKKEDGSIYLEEAVKEGANIIFVTDSDIKKYLNINPDIGIIKVDSGLGALKKIALYYRNMYQGKIVAITGSNGKTTTKEMIASTLSSKYKVFKSIKSYNNVIGICKMLLKLKEEDIAVFELGMNHAGEIKEMVDILKPDIGLITNIGTAHIGNLGSKEEILKAKLEITENGLEMLFVNKDDEYLKYVLYPNITNYSISDIDYLESDNNIIIYVDDTEIKVNTYGKHNLYNICSSIAIARYLKLSTSEIKKGLEEYQSFRMKKTIIKNTLIIDDSYNANPESMKAGIDYLNTLDYKNKILVLGDMLELGIDSSYYHKQVGEYIRKTSITKVYTFGKDSKYIGNSCQKISNHYIEKDYLALDLKEDLGDDTVIYFKGSRAMGLEEIIEKIR